jgi:WD40 repeat protein
VERFERQAPLKTFASQLGKQLRSIACHTDRRGFVYGGIEGRVRVQYLDSENQSSSFSFKCHRDDAAKHIFTVNVIKCHPMGPFMTGGADGTISIWDYRSSHRLKVASSFPWNSYLVSTGGMIINLFNSGWIRLHLVCLSL